MYSPCVQQTIVMEMVKVWTSDVGIEWTQLASNWLLHTKFVSSKSDLTATAVLRGPSPGTT